MTIETLKAKTIATTPHDHCLAEKGWTLLRGLGSSKEVEQGRKDISAAVKRLANEHRPLGDRDTYGKAFLQVTNLWRQDPGVEEFVFNSGFAQAAADILGVARVRIYHDQALFKEPGGGPTPWHQDMYYWPLATEMAVTMWMPLVDVTADMGLMRFAEGSHKDQHRGDLEISDESDSYYSRFVMEKGYRISGPDNLRAGDATFHLGWTIHSAGPNQNADRIREVMTIIYIPDGTPIAKPANPHQQADLEVFLGGRRPGELADSEMNPIMN